MITDQPFHNAEAMMLRGFTPLTNRPLFYTDVDPDALWANYLLSFPAAQRQHFNCHTCESFVRRFGGLVYVDEVGRLVSALWRFSTKGYKFPRLIKRVEASAIVRPLLLSGDGKLGESLVGGWEHWSVFLPPTYAAGDEHEAEVNFRTVQGVLNQTSRRTLEKALYVCTAHGIAKCDKVQEILGALLDMQFKHVNLQWVIFMHSDWHTLGHVSSSITGALIKDIDDKLPEAEVVRRHNERVDPMRYMRPQSAPSEGTIDRAEKLFAEMGLAPALRRRHAEISDLQGCWWSTHVHPQRVAGVFDNLREHPVEGPQRVMTFAKFQREVLPKAKSMELLLDSKPYNFAAFTTAVDANAPRLFKWNSPLGWYVYHGGSMPQSFNMRAGWATVLCVQEVPSQEGVVFCLHGCKDVIYRGGLCIFPEMLRHELHEVRSVIEAFSGKGRLMDSIRTRVPAAGFYLQKEHGQDVVLRVNGVAYRIDRWD